MMGLRGGAVSEARVGGVTHPFRTASASQASASIGLRALHAVRQVQLAALHLLEWNLAAMDIRSRLMDQGRAKLARAGPKALNGCHQGELRVPPLITPDAWYRGWKPCDDRPKNPASQNAILTVNLQ